MPYADNHGLRIHYEVTGEGAPLVLLHGFGVSGDAWHTGGHVSALKDEFEVITMDARGHGRSDKPHDLSAYSLRNRVLDVTAVLDDAGVDKSPLPGLLAWRHNRVRAQQVCSPSVPLGRSPGRPSLPRRPVQRL